MSTDRERRNAAQKRYCERHPERVAAQQKASRERNKEGVRAYAKSYYEANQEHLRAKRMDHYANNREWVLANQREQKKVNRERYAPKAKAWREANRETVKAYQQAYYAANLERLRAEKREYAKTYRKENRALLVRKSVEYGRKNKGKRHAWSTKWLATHPEYGREHSLRYARALRQATPPWTDKEALERFYDECPEGYHVDHIVPLRGKNVCGLHLAVNLQYLLPEENSRKKNSFDETQALAVSFGV